MEGRKEKRGTKGNKITRDSLLKKKKATIRRPSDAS
jgi:hypothetical protein